MPLQKPDDPSALTTRLANVFAWMEARGLRVAHVWLTKKHIEELGTKHKDCFDAIGSLAVRHSTPERGLYVGMMWGAQVYESHFAPDNHVALQSDNFSSGMPTGPDAFMPF